MRGLAMGTAVLLLLSVILMLAGCASAPEREPEPRVVTQTVRVPVPVQCLKPGDIPPEPDYPDAAIGPDTPDVAVIGWGLASNELRKGRIATLEALLSGCVQ